MAFDVEFKSSCSCFDVEYETDKPVGINFEDATKVVINAYDIAVANGFDGTVEEWLKSLVGPQGVKGDDGRDGYTPRKGIDYFDGKDGINGSNGRDGRDGKDGKDGARGADGYTPVKGIDYFDGKDGVNGKDGAKGEKGDPFTYDDFTPEQLEKLRGPKGDKGDGADVDLTPYAEKKYVDDSVYDAMHRSRSVRKLNTHQRNFAMSAWDNYGALGHIENWSNTANYQEFKVGDLGVLYGTNTTNGKFVALVGEVTQVASSLQMRTIACYQTDTYKEVTEYGVDLAEDLANALQDIESLESTKADKSEIPTVPKNISAFNNDAGYLKEHQDISGKLDASTFNDYTTQAEAVISQFQTWSATEQHARTQADDAHDLAIEDLQVTMAGKVNASEIPTKVSQLENDEKYLSEVKSDDIQPIAKKTYQNVIAKSNDQAGGTFSFLKVTPNSYYEPCYVKFRVRAYVNAAMTHANKPYFFEETESEMVISGTTLVRYMNKNQWYSSSYRPYYYLTVYRANQNAQKAGKPHYIGVSLYNSTSATTTTLKRDVEVELLEYSGCTVELVDELLAQSSFYNTTDYSGISNTDAYTLGTRMTGDSNSIDRLIYGSYTPKAGASLYGSQLVLSADGETYYSICQSRSTALTKKCATQGFRPEHIMYYSSSTTINTGSRVATSTLYEALPFDFRFSHNVKALTLHKPVYLKCTYRDGLYYLVPDGWMTQDLPTAEDGCYYILVGYSYSADNIYIKTVHPVYSYYNGACRKINGEVMELLGVIENGSY